MDITIPAPGTLTAEQSRQAPIYTLAELRADPSRAALAAEYWRGKLVERLDRGVDKIDPGGVRLAYERLVEAQQVLAGA